MKSAIGIKAMLKFPPTYSSFIIPRRHQPPQSKGKGESKWGNNLFILHIFIISNVFACVSMSVCQKRTPASVTDRKGCHVIHFPHTLIHSSTWGRGNFRAAKLISTIGTQKKESRLMWRELTWVIVTRHELCVVGGRLAAQNFRRGSFTFDVIYLF